MLGSILKELGLGRHVRCRAGIAAGCGGPRELEGDGGSRGGLGGSAGRGLAGSAGGGLWGSDGRRFGGPHWGSADGVVLLRGPQFVRSVTIA